MSILAINHREGNNRILIVDDEANNRLLLRRILHNAGEIVEAGDGDDAMALIETQAFDLVLLDIMMPRSSGYEVLGKIRALPQTSYLPVILISALTAKDDILRGLELGANDYITKPIDIDVVAARVNIQLQMKHAMDMQRRAIADLEATQEIGKRLFRIASHDLRAPLTNMRLAHTLLYDYLANEPEALDILSTLQTSVDKMKSIIEEFLDMASYRTGGVELDFTSVPARDIIEAVTMQYMPTASNKEVTFRLGDLDGIAYADYSRLEQVLINLVSNAIKYTPRGSTVRLWTTLTAGRIRFYIADEGAGIPIGEQDKLFKEFSKLSTRPTAGESSIGLGLWIVRQLVTMQNGTVGAENGENGGAVFWVELPVPA